MHGKLFLLDTGYAGIDEKNLYCRLDFIDEPVEWAAGDTRLVIAIENISSVTPTTHRLQADISGGRVHAWTFAQNGNLGDQPESIRVSLESIFECRVPLELLEAQLGATLRVRFLLWRDRLPLDALPQDGAIEARVLPESELTALAYAKP
jgi:hypothetical protein